MASTPKSSVASFVSLLLFFGIAATLGGPDRAAHACPSCAFGQSAAPQFERELTGGGMHTYGLALEPGQFVRAVFDQRGVDVQAALLDPEGREVLRVNNPSGSWGVDALFYEAERGGKYTIVVNPAASSAPPGRYEFDIEKGDVGATDERRLGAERSLARASRLTPARAGEADGPSAGRYEEALRLFRAASDPRGEIITLEIAGTVEAATGDAQKALAHFDELLKLQRAAKDRRGEATTLGRTGQIFYSLDNKQKALEHFDQALALFRELDDKRMAAYTLASAGLARAGMTDRRDALDAFQNALALMRAVGDRRGEAFVLNQLGLLYDALGDRKQSHRSHSELLQLLRETGNCQELAPALSNLAWASLESEDKRKAVEYLNEALSIQQGVGDRRGEAATLNNLGFVFNSLGDRAKALSHLRRSLTLFSELADKQGEGDVSSNLMYLWKSDRKPGAAIFYGKRAVNAYQSARAELPPLDVMAQRSFIKSKALTYNELADLLVTHGRLLEAQQVIDLLKEHEYLDFVRRGGESSKAGATLTAAETGVEQKYEALADQLVLRGRQRGELLAKQTRSPEEEQLLSKIETELQASGQAFQSFLDRLGDELGNTRQAARVDQLRDSQALMDDLRELGPGAVALYTLVGAEKYRVILITPNVQKAAEYPIKAEELERKVFALREALRDPRSDARPQLEAMYRILVGPIAKDLRDAQAETLMWSLDGSLRYVPMAALHDGEKYMVERYRNVVFTPASNSRLKDAPSAKWSAFGAGVTKSHANFSALPGVQEELHGIIREQEADPGGVLEGKVLLDDAFTLETFRAALRQRFQVVHIASHFAVQPGNERDSFLLLGDGNRLSLSEIRSAVNLFGGVELLTLSACDTATGGTGADGKEVESFAVLAQRQGAKAVMASLWPVADESTKQLMQNFYRLRNAQAGTAKAEALRQAQLALLRGGTDTPAPGGQSRGIGVGLREAGVGKAKTSYSHPFFWAPFILIGNWL
ncbi:MAG TPA: CHAT domain-containing protein [Pyrinomonadaceae bacterium]|nr:CHAT domain-containing protein [Pyrinomonadaceae bacterium]